MSKSNLCAAVVALAISAVIVGCQEPTQDELAFEREKELLRMQMQHEQNMARIEADKIAAENQVSHTYIENEYEYEYEDERHNYGSQSSGSVMVNPNEYSSAPINTGYSGGDLLVTAAGAATAGYIAGKTNKPNTNPISTNNNASSVITSKGVESGKSSKGIEEGKGDVKRDVSTKPATERGGFRETVKRGTRKIASSKPLQGAKEVTKKAAAKVKSSVKGSKK